MSVSDVQIAKLALQHLGDRYDITSLGDDRPEAEQVNLVFNNARDALLREHPWKFTLRYTSPSSLVGTPPAYWDYMFAYPAEAVKVWRIVHPLDPVGTDLPPIPWSVARNSDDVKVLLTNEQEPMFEYSKRVETASEFDDNFVMALSWRIAALVAMPITGDASLAGSIEQKMTRKVGLAKENDANEGVGREQSRDPDWIRARS